jgi:hypothetical protein
MGSCLSFDHYKLRILITKMKNCLASLKILTVILLFVSIPLVCSAQSHNAKAEKGNVNLFWKGKTKYSIVYSKNALPAEITAVGQLQKYIKLITGVDMKAYSDDSHKKEKCEIVVGHTNRENQQLSAERQTLVNDGFIIKWDGNSVFITGSGKNYGRSTLYGAFEFLRLMGCEFYAKDTETVPHKSTIVLSKATVKQSSPFEYRDLYWSCSFGEDISAKMRLNGCLSKDKRKITPQYGGEINYVGDHFVHTFSSLVPPEKYFATHPEYFSEIDGKRTAKNLYSQLCMTNPDVFRIVLNNVREWLRSDTASKIVSVSQNDSFVINSYCTCEKCKAINDAEGSPMGALLRFVNQVADSIKGEFPDVAVDLLAYQYSVTPPKITVPRDNVIVRYCTGSCSAHSIGKCAANQSNVQYIGTWGKICNRIYIWDYTTNFAQYLCPFPNFYTLKDNIQFFKNNGVKGVFEQGMYQEGESGEFGDLRAYVLSKLLWNPEENTDTLIDHFMPAYYGKGAPQVRKYFNFIHKVIADNGKDFNLVVNCADLFNGLISDDDIKTLDKLWVDAAAACVNGSKEQRHVLRSQLSYRFYKLMSKRDEFANDTDKVEENKFYKDCNDLGVTRLNEGSNIPWVENK